MRINRTHGVGEARLANCKRLADCTGRGAGSTMSPPCLGAISVQLFLHAKHWQVFLMMAIPLGSFRFFGAIFSPLELGIMLMLFVGVVASWLYAVGMASNEKLDASLKLDTRLFKIGLSLPLLYMLVIFVVVLMPLSQGITDAAPPGWIVILHFGALAGAFYAFWFTAKQFATVRKGTKATYIEYAASMLGFWLGIFGVWFLQPKINHTFGDN